MLEAGGVLGPLGVRMVVPRELQRVLRPRLVLRASPEGLDPQLKDAEVWSGPQH